MGAVEARVRDVFKTIDTMNGTKFAECLTPDGTFVFGNADPVSGRQTVAAYVDLFFSAIAGIHHEVEEVWISGDCVISRFKVTYTRKQGDRMTFPGVNVWRMSGDLIADYRIYLDITPLWS